MIYIPMFDSNLVPNDFFYQTGGSKSIMKHLTLNA
jgi:hypothetical protein